MTTHPVQLSIIIVNYNVKYFLEQCLYTVRKAAEGLDVEIFVVDNHSSDDSMAYLKPLFPEVIYIENADNPGFAKANNQAIRQSRGRYVLLLNPDTLVGEETFRTLCAFMDEHPEAGGAGVKMLDGHGRFLPESKRSFPTPWISFCKLFGLSKLFPRSRRFAAYSLPYLDPDRPHAVDVLSGAFMLLRREALDHIGLLDESFFMYGEDIDLSYRLVLGGYRNYYVPLRLLHYKGESTKRGDRKFLNAFYGAMLIFYQKYYAHSGVWMSALIRWGVGMRRFYASLFERERKSASTADRPCRRILGFCQPYYRLYVEKAIACNIGWAIPFITYNPLFLLPFTNFRELQRHNYTDIIFLYPDVSFDSMLLFMDSNPDKTVTYHIYHAANAQLISPGR